jgi:two-component system, chemotaxis family, CheB/CheR fusion protein
MEEPLGPEGNLGPDVNSAEHEAAAEAPDDASPPDGARVIGLGGSAGGIPALRKFFQAMPADSSMAFVVVLHLSPEHDSMLSEILQKETSMRVAQATDGAEVEPNHVYVIPPAKHLSLRDGHLRLTDLPREPGRRMTVDLFFRSLAETHGSRAVAIVLSGGDGDGAIGIKRIKERGGLTIAQDPEAAEHSGMPNAAIATNMVDWVLRAEEMPARLLEYHAREQRLQVPPETGPNPATPPQPTLANEELALRDVLAFLRARTGRDFTYYKRATIVRRVARRMHVNEVDDLPAYLNFLRTHPGESRALLEDLLISVTNFFRDKEAFAALEQSIPDLFKNKTQADTVRVWVPACATGEEAYSIAMLLNEHARTLEAPPALQIFATDLDENVLAEARAGVYPTAITSDVSPERLRRYFIQEHHGYRVRRELRELLLFAVHDLLKDSPFSRLDMVSCRNLLIYLNRGAQRRAFDIFHFALRPDGRLFLGTSEAIDEDSPLFHPIDKKHRLYAQRVSLRPSLPVPSGPGTLARALALQERGEPGITLASKGLPASSPARAGSLWVASQDMSWGELHLKLIERFGPPSLIVNADHEILHLSQGAAPFLQFTAGEPSTNLLRAVHPSLRVELRAALFRARQTGEPAIAQGIPFELADEPRLLDLRVSPASELASEFLLVVFELQPAIEGQAPRPRPEDEPVVRHLERELEQTKGHLRDLAEQHDASTEELKASNEELQAMNEELRSATEELETSREELQSINEELTTVNQELKSKVDELGTSNSDLHNLMGATAIATLFVDRHLRIMRYTPPAVALFNVISSDVGRPLADLQHRLDYPDLLPDLKRVLETLVPIEQEVRNPEGKLFLARLLPYRTTDDHIAGVVLTFVDVTERQLAQEELKRAQLHLEERVRERTAELDAVNAVLQAEVRQHQKAEKARQYLQRRLVTSQEEERGRISRELHDEVGQQLMALMLSLKALEATVVDGDTPAKLRELRATAERAGREIHQLAAELRPVALDQVGLSRALSGYLESWLKRTGIAVDFVSVGIDELRLPPPIETTLYRIVQEAMTNVYKHASAKSVSVSVTRRGDDVLAIVEDDGAGFDLEALNTSGGVPRIGIAGMRERAAIVDGELTIDSSPGHGTTVRVKVPIPPGSMPPPPL